MISSYFKIIRPVNLLIMALTMYFLRYFYFKTALDIFNIDLIASDWQYSCLVLSVLLAAASGYVINDIYDYKADIVNKPESVVTFKLFSRKQLVILYIILVILSLLGAWFATHTSLLPIIVTVIFNSLLFLYSSTLKAMPFVSNVIVSAIIAFIPAYALLYDIPSTLYHVDVDSYEHLSKEILEEKFNRFIFFFMEMAFFINLSREIIKDIIDIKGDKELNIKTIPMIYGVDGTRVFVAILLLTTGGLILIHPALSNMPYSFIFFLTTVIPCILSAAYLLWNSKFKKSSVSLKLAMFIALMYLPLFHFILGHHDA
ncbi:MAG: UbiA family prenyltransferase [Crocinitomicaceae bacterium]|nr:UbiA family prenyltransferase [Crocinitomicaceae bacterium]